MVKSPPAPTYIECIARDIWEEAGGLEGDVTLRIGEPNPWYPKDEAALWLGYAVLCLAKGSETTSRDVHDAWSAWATIHYTDFVHRSAVPFDELTPEVRAYDDEYRDAIHRVALRHQDQERGNDAIPD